MKILIALVIIVIIANKNYIQYMWKEYVWKEHVVDSFPKNLPPFCFDCNESSCVECKAHEAYLISPDRGWKVWNEIS